MENSTRWPGLVALAVALVLPLAVRAQYVPPVPPPTCVENCDGAARDVPPTPPRCRYVTVRYVCGTREVCQDFGPPKGIVCVDVEEECERTEEICE